MNKIDWKKVTVFLTISFVIMGLVSATVYLYLNYIQTKALLNDPQKLGKEQAKELTTKVSALMEIPIEEPTVVTILDKSKLQDHPFFRYAQNGDRILIFSNAKRAVLYRPSINKIVDVTGVNQGDNTVISQQGEVAGSSDLQPTVQPTVAPTIPRWQPTPSTLDGVKPIESSEFGVSPTPTVALPSVTP